MNKKKPAKPTVINFVAKHAHKFNRAVTFKVKTKYSRKGKSQKGFPFDVFGLSFFSINYLAWAGCFLTDIETSTSNNNTDDY